MYRRTLFLCGALGSMFMVPALARSDEQAAEAALEAKGLRKVGVYFVADEESEVGKKVRDLASLQRQLRDVHAELAKWEQRERQKNQLIVGYLQKRRQLRAQLARTSSVNVHNRIVTALNELGDRINLMQQDEQGKQALEEARAAANKVREQYVGQLLEARQLIDKLKKQYETLEADKSVGQAIEAYGKATDRTYRLGPSSSFLSYDRRLKKYESAVISEKIDLRRGSGNLWYVPVVFNDGHVQEMAIDTGASVIAMPWSVAKAAGMTPTEDDPTIHVSVADGRQVPAKEVTAKKVRVGKFTVEDVRCCVMPEEFHEAPCLLGLSFMGNFSFKIDTAEGKLIMSQIKESGSSGRQSR